MNLQDIAKKEAKERYCTDITKVGINEFHINSIRVKEWSLCTKWLLNTLAGSEGDLNTFYEELAAMMIVEDASDIQIKEALKSFVASAVAKAVVQKWVSVEERLPEYGSSVLMCDYLKNIHVCKFKKVFIRKLDDQHIGKEYSTYWQPLPTPPSK